MPPRALLPVSLQDSFCAGGTFAVPEGDGTMDAANRLIDQCQSRGEAVITSQDWHPASHDSFTSQHGVEPYTPGQLDGLPQTLWPDHCVRNGEGAQLHPLLKQKAITAVFHRGKNPLVGNYSTFSNNGRRQKTALNNRLHAHVIDELIVMDLAIDYYVKFTVLDASQLSYKVDMITDGYRGINIQSRDSAHAFMEMSAAGATLYTLAD